MITKKHFHTVLALVGIVFLASCQKEVDQLSADLDQSTIRSLNYTLSPKAALGRKIYFDKRFSSTGTQSCSSCHLPEQGFVGKATINSAAAPGFLAGIGEGAVKGRFGGRKPPSASYATFSPAFQFDPINGEYVGGLFWDGRATGSVTGTPAGDQAIGPFMNPVEHDMASIGGERAVLRVIANDPTYQALWKAAWGSNLNITDATYLNDYYRVGLSIGEFEASPEVNQFSSKFDAWLRAGSPANGGGIMTAREIQGMNLFVQAECDNCHVMEGAIGLPGPLFTDFGYANIGLSSNTDFISATPTLGNAPTRLDNGLLGFLIKFGENDPQILADAEGAFKTPTLRNVAKGEANKRFMHNGVLRSLKEVVHFYNTRDTDPVWGAPEFPATMDTRRVGDLGLSDEEEDLIVEFMRTLSDGYTRARVNNTQRVL